MANPEHLEIIKQGVKVWNKWMEENSVVEPDFDGADLSVLDLTGANLSGGSFRRTIFFDSKLIHADLRGAYLFATNFTYTDLSYANFSNASILFTIFHNALLRAANLKDATIGEADFSATDFTDAVGFDTCKHVTPSAIDYRTLQMSGRLPLSFLRGCGLPDTLIEFIPSLLNDPIQFYASFISYSSKDQKFADRIYADLQNKGVRCWLATEDLKIGDRIRTGIDEAIRLHEKLLLVLSKDSVASDWVEQEVETALERERKEKRLILFPIRLDNAVMKVEGGWPALIRNTRNIGDFTRWKDHDLYQKSFARLLRDLKAEEK